MPWWTYLKAGFWQRVSLPLVGPVPLNAAAALGFALAGCDEPIFWAAGATWQVAWLGGTAGRTAYRRRLAEAGQRGAWRGLEERRLQLYQQLPAPQRQRHLALRAHAKLGETPGEPGAELFAWLHLKLLLAQIGPRPAADPDLPRLHAAAAVELTDPARARLADEAVALLDPRQGLADATLSWQAQAEAVLERLERGLGSPTAPSSSPPRAATQIPPPPIFAPPSDIVRDREMLE